MKLIDKYPLLRLEVKLVDSPRPVWRHLTLRAGTSMRDLHHIIQAIMPWTTSHLYEFTYTHKSSMQEIRIADTDLWDNDLPRENDDRLFYVEDVFIEIGNKVTYIYDIGDYWIHQITLMDIENDPFLYPVIPYITAGEGQCPPEDSGGIDGYKDILRIISDKEDPEYSSTWEWLSGMRWKPGKFNPAKLQGLLNKYKATM